MGVLGHHRRPGRHVGPPAGHEALQEPLGRLRRAGVVEADPQLGAGLELHPRPLLLGAEDRREPEPGGPLDEDLVAAAAVGVEAVADRAQLGPVGVAGDEAGVAAPHQRLRLGLGRPVAVTARERPERPGQAPPRLAGAEGHGDADEGDVDEDDPADHQQVVRPGFEAGGLAAPLGQRHHQRDLDGQSQEQGDGQPAQVADHLADGYLLVLHGEYLGCECGIAVSVEESSLSNRPAIL